MQGKKDNLMGQRFGRLTVIAPTASMGTGAMWLCRCDCGDTVTVRARNLKNGNTKSCGCGRGGAIDLEGQRFGRLTVLRRATREDYLFLDRKGYWVCRCDCGNETVVSCSSLRSGKTRSCGCARGKKDAGDGSGNDRLLQIRSQGRTGVRAL